MRQITRWLAILLVAASPLVALAQERAGPAGPEERVTSAQAEGSALPRFTGDERRSWPQRVILVVLATLLTTTLIFGLATIAHAFRDEWAHRRHRA